MVDQSRSLSKKIGTVMLTDSFSQCCCDASDTSPSIYQAASSLQVTKRKENKMTVIISPLFTLIYAVLSNQSIYTEARCSGCHNFEENKSSKIFFIFSRKMCQSFDGKKALKSKIERQNISYPTKNSLSQITASM